MTKTNETINIIDLASVTGGSDFGDTLVLDQARGQCFATNNAGSQACTDYALLANAQQAQQRVHDRAMEPGHPGAR